MKNMKDIKIVRDVIDEALHDINARGCRVQISKEDQRTRGYPETHIDIKYIDPTNKDAIQIGKYYLTGTTIQTGFTSDSLYLDLNEPGSIEKLKATLGFNYDFFSNKRWKAILLMPWSLTKMIWRVREVVKVEGREWLGGRFTKPQARQARQ